MKLVSQKIRNAAKGRPCTLRIPSICNNDWSTTVLCHAPDKTRGKAMKTFDTWSAFGCSACHTALDLKEVDNPETYWLQGIRETQGQLIEAGLIIVSQTASKPKQISKLATGGTELQRRRMGV